MHNAVHSRAHAQKEVVIVHLVFMVGWCAGWFGNRWVGHLPGGHLPSPYIGHLLPPNSDICHPQKTYICQEDNCHPPCFLSFSGALFLAFSTYSSLRTSRMGRRRCLTRWPWSTSSRRCVTRWSWSTSSRRCVTRWSWSTSSKRWLLRTSRRRKGRLSFMFLFMAAWITHF